MISTGAARATAGTQSPIATATATLPGERLSERRAQSVKTWLFGGGFLPANASTAGYGEKMPVAANENSHGTDNPAGRQLNRRVELVRQ